MYFKTVRKFQSKHRIPHLIWEQILQKIRFSPSSFDLQPWRFFIIESAYNKAKLKKCLKGNMQQLETSSAMILVCGDLEKTKWSSYIYEQKYLRKWINKEEKQKILAQINAHYQQMSFSKLTNEICFECGLIAAHLVVVSKDFGYNTCFIGGCDFDMLQKKLKINLNYLPIILIAIGKEELGEEKKKTNPFKLELKDFVTFL
ncbi:MAG: nitroreductase family protein [Vigna little leaf phytoplasma]|nr:nitroreductase family protein [Vigna little leaf phytoplasma]